MDHLLELGRPETVEHESRPRPGQFGRDAAIP